MVSLFNVLIKKYTSFESNNVQRLFIQCDISQDNEWIGGICDDGSVSVYSKEMNMKIYEFRIKNDFITQFALNTELMICSVVGHKGASIDRFSYLILSYVILSF